MTGEGETGVMGPRGEECLQAPQAEQAKNRSSPLLPCSLQRERVQPDFLFLDFLTSSFQMAREKIHVVLSL